MMREWYDKRRITISTLEVKFLIQVLEEKVRATIEALGVHSQMLLEETDPAKRKLLEDTIMEEKRIIFVTRGFLRRLRGLLRGQKKQLKQIHLMTCLSLVR